MVIPKYNTRTKHNESHIGVYGASGFGKEVMPLVRQQFPTLAKDNFYLDDSQAGNSLNGYVETSYQTLPSTNTHKETNHCASQKSLLRKLVQQEEIIYSI